MDKQLEVSRRGGRIAVVGPAIVAELKTLTEKNQGLLMPEDVVQAARRESSPLHSQFEWDDGEAAERYRIWQARRLISVSVERIFSGTKQIQTKVFVSLSTDRKTGGYRTFVDVVADDDQRSRMIQDSLDAMVHFQEKYKWLSELREIFKAMDKTAKKLARK